MKISEAYGDDRFGLSFELFPPKTEAGFAALRKHVGILNEFAPSYITCTYGAGGSTRDKTLDILESVASDFKKPVASHLTCVGSTVDELRSYLLEASQRGIENIVALRGDPPSGETSFSPMEGGLRYANELVDLIRSEFPTFGIAVAGYPEKHQESPSAEEDLENLKRKVDSGAHAVITQLFYSNDDFFKFRDCYDRIGVRVPLVPGLLPVTNLAQIQRITSLCGATLPQEFIDELSRKDDPSWQFEVGVEFATRQVQALIDRGVPGIHFYVLNQSGATHRVLSAISLPVNG